MSEIGFFGEVEIEASVVTGVVSVKWEDRDISFYGLTGDGSDIRRIIGMLVSQDAPLEDEYIVDLIAWLSKMVEENEQK